MKSKAIQPKPQTPTSSQTQNRAETSGRKETSLLINLHRTSRIQFRCTPVESAHINALANALDRSLADFVRDSITIAVANDPNRSQWDRKLATAIVRIADRSPWTTS